MKLYLKHAAYLALLSTIVQFTIQSPMNNSPATDAASAGNLHEYEGEAFDIATMSAGSSDADSSSATVQEHSSTDQPCISARLSKFAQDHRQWSHQMTLNELYKHRKYLKSIHGKLLTTLLHDHPDFKDLPFKGDDERLKKMMKEIRIKGGYEDKPREAQAFSRALFTALREKGVSSEALQDIKLDSTNFRGQCIPPEVKRERNLAKTRKYTSKRKALKSFLQPEKKPSIQSTSSHTASLGKDQESGKSRNEGAVRYFKDSNEQTMSSWPLTNAAFARESQAGHKIHENLPPTTHDKDRSRDMSFLWHQSQRRNAYHIDVQQQSKFPYAAHIGCTPDPFQALQTYGQSQMVLEDKENPVTDYLLSTDPYDTQPSHQRPSGSSTQQEGLSYTHPCSSVPNFFAPATSLLARIKIKMAKTCLVTIHSSV